MRVWDPLVRVLHWSLAVSVGLAWLTHEGWGRWHDWFGYAALALVAVRVAWGFAGPRFARFGSFVRAPVHVANYAGRMARGVSERYVGHNPLGGWMIVALLVNVALVGASGWLYTTDAFWGVEWVEDLHEALADFLLALIALHVCGVVASSIVHRENLAAAMIHGRKRNGGPGDVL